MTKEIDNFRIEAEHKLTDLKEKSSNTIAKLREQEQANEDRLEKVYQKIINIVDSKLEKEISNTADKVKDTLDQKVKLAPSNGSWKTPFFLLVVALAAAGSFGYKKYQALRKSHLL